MNHELENRAAKKGYDPIRIGQNARGRYPYSWPMGERGDRANRIEPVETTRTVRDPATSTAENEDPQVSGRGGRATEETTRSH